MTRDHIKKILEDQDATTVTVLSSLLAVHDELGYLPKKSIEEVAVMTNTSINEVWGVATFYTNFRLTPPTKHVVEVCWGPTCHILGATEIMQQCISDLGLSGEGDTEDSQISLKYNTCLGACSRAPVVSIDHHLHGNSNPESLSGKLARLSGNDH